MISSGQPQPTPTPENSPFAHDTSGRSAYDWAKSLAVLVIGLTVAHLGVTLFLLSELGTDTFTVFIQGLSHMFGLSVGTFHVIVLCLLMLFMLLFTRGYVKPGTVVCAFLGGPIIDLFTWLLGGVFNAAAPLAVRFAVMVAGCVILSLGMSIVISSEAGTGPNDLVALILTDRLVKLQFRWVRMACDLFFVFAGWLLGGVVGLGTIAAAVLTGPAVQFWLPKSRAIVARFLAPAQR